jgi:GPN-loop GTPase
MAGEPVSIYFIGTAGAGKSTLVAAYDRWAKQHGLSTVLVNLDPGAEQLPYTPDVDIRDWVKISEIMEENGLGPNGAQVAAADMIALNLDEVQSEIASFRADHILVDTPGQLELFVFRQSGKHIVSTLNPQRSVVAYLLDPFLARTASGFTSQLLLGATTQFRFQEPLVFLLSRRTAWTPRAWRRFAPGPRTRRRWRAMSCPSRRRWRRSSRPTSAASLPASAWRTTSWP